MQEVTEYIEAQAEPKRAEVMLALADDLADYVTSKSSFQFAMDTPLPKSLITKLIQARIKEIEAK